MLITLLISNFNQMERKKNFQIYSVLIQMIENCLSDSIKLWFCRKSDFRKLKIIEVSIEMDSIFN